MAITYWQYFKLSMLFYQKNRGLKVLYDDPVWKKLHIFSKLNSSCLSLYLDQNTLGLLIFILDKNNLIQINVYLGLLFLNI